MRKKVSIVLFSLIGMVALSACGEKDNPTNTTPSEIASLNEVVSTRETNNIVEPEVTTKEDVETENVNTDNTQLVDWVIGEDIAVYETPENGWSVSNLPPISVQLPSKDNVVGTVVMEDGNTEYTINVNGIDSPIVICASLIKTSDDNCNHGYHKEFVEYGRYSIDIGNRFEVGFTTTYTTIIDTETEFAIGIDIGLYDENGLLKDLSESDIAVYKELYDMNIEYIKEQVSGWDSNYVAVVTNEGSDSNEVIIDEEWVSGYLDAFYGTYNCTAGYATVEIIPNTNDGNDTLIATDIANNTVYECELVPAGDNYFQAIYNGEVALNVETTGTGLFIDIDLEEYVNLYGEYSKQ